MEIAQKNFDVRSNKKLIKLRDQFEIITEHLYADIQDDEETNESETDILIKIEKEQEVYINYKEEK